MDMKRKPVFECPVNATRKVYDQSRETYEPHFAAH